MQGEGEVDDAVLQQLDDKVTKYMALVESLLQLREGLSQIMKNGFFNLSKAKYTMGTTTISPLAYPQRMCANTFLKTSPDSPSKPTHFSLSLATFTTTTGDNGNDNTTVRRRRNSQDGSTGTTTMTSTQVVKYGSGDVDDDEQNSGGIQRDPLLWFGVLVSPHLRQSQKDFQKALGMIVEIANVTQQLEMLQQEYFKLLQTKSATKPIL